MLWLYRFFSGYLVIAFSGQYAEQLINLAAQQRLTIWNMHCRKGIFTGCVSVRSFPLLRPLRHGTGIKIHILKKCGVPFLTRGYRFRFGLFAGFAAFFLILQVLSGSVWRITVTGNKTVPETQVLSACEKLGIGIGTRIDSVDTAAASQRLLLQEPSFAWASLNIEGCQLTVNVSEVKNRVSPDAEEPSNLIAAADGKIQKIDVTSGTVLVRVGDTVAKGDLLVSGILEGMNSTSFVPSVGSITAQTRRTFSASGVFSAEELRPTGTVCRRSVFSIFGLRIPLYLGAVKGEYHSTTEQHSMTLFGQQLPLAVITAEYRMLTPVLCDYSDEELTILLKEKIAAQIADAGITDYELLDEKTVAAEGGLQVTQTISAVENIAFREKILFKVTN